MAPAVALIQPQIAATATKSKGEQIAPRWRKNTVQSPAGQEGTLRVNGLRVPRVRSIQWESQLVRGNSIPADLPIVVDCPFAVVLEKSGDGSPTRQDSCSIIGDRNHCNSLPGFHAFQPFLKCNKSSTMSAFQPYQRAVEVTRDSEYAAVFTRNAMRCELQRKHTVR